MTTRKTAPLEGGLIVRKGEAAPAAVGSPRQKPVALTVKVPPELYVRLKSLSVETEQHQTTQEMVLDAIEAYVERREAQRLR